MFERQIVPVYLGVCALALVVWSLFAPTTTPSTGAWILGGMAGLYFAATLLDRATRSPGMAQHMIEEATQVNAARMTAPRVTGDIEDPRR